MSKIEIRTNLTWIKIREFGTLKDYLYGLRDGTDNHGHTIIDMVSGMRLVHQRNISGMELMVSGNKLLLNNNLLL